MEPTGSANTNSMSGFFPEVVAAATDRATRADPGYKAIDVAFGLSPDLRTGGFEVGRGIGGVFKLIDEEAVGVFLGESTGQVLVVLRVPAAHVGTSQNHFCVAA